MSKLSPGWEKASVLDIRSCSTSFPTPWFYTTRIPDYRHQPVGGKLFGMASEEMLGKHQEIFNCSVCEPGCGMLAGLNQRRARNSTVRLYTEPVWSVK